MNFNDVFYYDEYSPSCLRWKIWNGQHNHSKRIQHDIAGFIGKSTRKNYSFYKVGYKSKEYKVHRIIWELYFGNIPDGSVIDHIDGNQFNNKISNLRIVGQKENCQNSSLRSDSKTGKCGITISKIKNIFYYRTYVTKNGKQTSKVFSIDKYGKEQAFQLALQWRESQLKELNLSGENYTDRHGETKELKC